MMVADKRRSRGRDATSGAAGAVADGLDRPIARLEAAAEEWREEFLKVTAGRGAAQVGDDLGYEVVEE